MSYSSTWPLSRPFTSLSIQACSSDVLAIIRGQDGKLRQLVWSATSCQYCCFWPVPAWYWSGPRAESLTGRAYPWVLWLTDSISPVERCMAPSGRLKAQCANGCVRPACFITFCRTGTAVQRDYFWTGLLYIYFFRGARRDGWYSLINLFITKPDISLMAKSDGLLTSFFESQVTKWLNSQLEH